VAVKKLLGTASAEDEARDQNEADGADHHGYGVAAGSAGHPTCRGKGRMGDGRTFAAGERADATQPGLNCFARVTSQIRRLSGNFPARCIGVVAHVRDEAAGSAVIDRFGPIHWSTPLLPGQRREGCTGSRACAWRGAAHMHDR